MLEVLGFILLTMLIIVVVIAAIVLAIVRLATRVERRLGRLTGSNRPRSRRAARSRSTRRSGRARGKNSRSKPGPARADPARPAGPIFRIRSVFEPKPRMRWMGQDTTLRLHELAIPAPLVYVAVDRRASAIPLDPSEIIGSLPVNPRGRATPAADWPRYSLLTPEQRSAYLAWLAGGRAALPHDTALLLLFFIGLERRALEDGADLPQIVGEVCRLRELAARAMASPGATAPAQTLPSFMRQTGAFLWMMVALRPEAFTERDLRVLASRTTTWSEDALAAALAWFARSAAPALPAWMAAFLAPNLPGARRSVIVDRLPEELASLLETRQEERHPGGVALRIAKRPRVMAYRPANDSLRPAEARVPDPLGIASQFAPLVELWNACIEDLRGLSRVATADDKVTLAQWEAMPPELRAGMENPFAPALAALAGAHADDDGHAIVPVGALIEAVRMKKPDRASLSATLSRSLAGAIADAGMALEPDARLTGARYALAGEVVLCPVAIPIESSPEGAARYLAASGVLRLGAAVALADGAAEEQELRPIAQELERAFELSEADHRRLDALSALLRARGSEVKSVGKRLLAAMPPPLRSSVGHLLVAIAAADGVVGDHERKLLRACFRALGLETADLDLELARLAEAPEPSQHEMDEGYTPLRLDQAAIRAIMAETREVAQILAEAMRGDDEDSEDRQDEPADEPRNSARAAEAPAAPPAPTAPTPTPQPPRPDVAPAGPAGMQARYVPFFTAIMARTAWSIQDAGTLAREHNLMLSGAVEAINDWSYDRADGPLLIEDGDRLLIDADRREMLEPGTPGA